ncbi:MAG: hypothetical protein DRP86_08115, partial [Candidatus Neomarinimicrobiota bacterium]
GKKTPLDFENSLLSLDMNNRHFEIIYSDENPLTKRPNSGTFHIPSRIPDGPVCSIFNMS